MLKEKMNENQIQNNKTHPIFNQGDTVWKICQQNNITLDFFSACNPHIRDLNVVLAGEHYYLPNSQFQLTLLSLNETRSNQEFLCHCNISTSGFHEHKFMQGDTVFKICNKYGIKLTDFHQINPHIHDLDCVYVGQPYVLQRGPINIDSSSSIQISKNLISKI